MLLFDIDSNCVHFLYKVFKSIQVSVLNSLTQNCFLCGGFICTIGFTVVYFYIHINAILDANHYLSFHLAYPVDRN